MNKILLSLSILLFANNIFAQDSTKKQTINITSAYKPILRNAVKINLAASQLPLDSSKPNLKYSIPSQNLFYAYKPISLRPLALIQDSNLYLGNRNFVKVGFGNLSTAYIKAGISLGDGKKSLVNINGDFIQSKGNIANQNFTNATIKAAGSYFLQSNELYGGIGFGLNTYHLYGYNHSLYKYDKSQVEQQFQNIDVSVGFKNTKPSDWGISYNPNIQLNLFTSKNKVNETNVIAIIPLEKTINDRFNLKVEANADITQYNIGNIVSNTINISNNIFQINPSINYNAEKFKIHAGITPVWSNKKYALLPDVYVEAKVKDKIFSIQAGWIGRMVKNSYKNLVEINPYLSPILSQQNTKEIELYGGIKASAAKHFNFSAKAAIINYKDLPLFINDTTSDNKSFFVSNETNINNFRLHGDISYINQDKFSLTAGITFNGYTSLQSNAKAWHTLPVEIKGSLRWWLLKTVLLKSDVYFFDGSNYISKGNIANTMGGGTDLSTGLEFSINKRFSIWGDVNNILNSKYERWHNYEVYGANFVGGVIVKF